mmetsp:Transcript_103436/g.186644  ORF Transcript_103436/g.186644 Transcript_103436/m.186644 type:complete len:296 (-) Transcript_103436:75-962(-)
MATRVGGQTARTFGPSRFGASPISSSADSAVTAETFRGPAAGTASKPSAAAVVSSIVHSGLALRPSSFSSASSSPSFFSRRSPARTPRRVLRPAARNRSASSTASTTSGSRSPPRRLMSSMTSSSPSLCFSPPSAASCRRSARHAAMRCRSSSCGSNISTCKGDPSKGSVGPRTRISPSMTLRSQTFPEPGNFTGSSISCPRSPSRNSGGSLSPSFSPCAESTSRFARSSSSFWCRGTKSLLWVVAPGLNRTETWMAKSRAAGSSSAPTPRSPSFRCCRCGSSRPDPHFLREGQS